MTTPAKPIFPARRHRFLRLAILLACGAAFSGRGEAGPMANAPAGVHERGVPYSIIQGPESLGLGAPPTDIHLLPDGRTVVVGADRIALGDGVRWEAFGRAPDTEPLDLDRIATGPDGRLYAAVPGGIARIDLAAGSCWRYTRVADLPATDPPLDRRILNRVYRVGDEWYSTAGNGVIVGWQPDRAPRIVGYINDVENVFEAAGHAYVSDPSIGQTFRIHRDRLEPLDRTLEMKVDHTIICSAPRADGQSFVGTYSVGLRLFDGRRLIPLLDQGPLAGVNRIADLCTTEGGLYCAALDNVGIAFFDADGKVVQTLDRTIDHRFSRTRKLLRGSGGVIWALLNEGVAQIEFPARISRIDPLVSTGLTYAQLTRFRGTLWLLAGGKAQHAAYTEDGRLARFEVDTPPPFVSAIDTRDDTLFAATNEGLFWRSTRGWETVDAHLRTPSIAPRPYAPGQWLIVAHGTVGWLHTGPGDPAVETRDVPELGIPFGRMLHGEGAYWVELGSSRCARITISESGAPEVRILDREDGFPDGWVQSFEIDGRIRFNLAGTVFRFDPASDRIVPDPSFLAGLPPITGLHGRPARDPAGRIWLATDRTVEVLAPDPSGQYRRIEPMPPALRPISFQTQDDGVVWMHQRQQLYRYDPRMPEPSAPPLQAVISHVQLPASGRQWLQVGPELPPLPYSDNSLSFHFVAPNHLFRDPVGFEVMLEGADRAWAATGPAGVASFNRLKEGRYVLHVRPRSGTRTGREATLGFTIRPPWHRTPLAYAAYTLAALGLLFVIARTWTQIAKREQQRLERLVAERTAELRRSEDNYRHLSEQLEVRVQERTAELTASNRELEAFSYSISHDLRSPLRNISGFAELLRKRMAAQLDPDSRRFVDIIVNEATRLGQLIDALLVFSRLARTELQRKPCDLGAFVVVLRGELEPQCADRTIEWRVGALPLVEGDPALMRQVLANLMSNALKFTRGRSPAIIEIGTLQAVYPDEHTFFVRDNGVGFDPRYSAKLFGVFQRLHHARDFEGSGIGLANVRRIVTRHGGRVWAESQPGKGSTFFVAMPKSFGRRTPEA